MRTRDDPAWSEAWQRQRDEKRSPSVVRDELLALLECLRTDRSAQTFVTRCQTALDEGRAEACMFAACSLLCSASFKLPAPMNTRAGLLKLLHGAGFEQLVVRYLTEASYPTPVRRSSAPTLTMQGCDPSELPPPCSS